MAWINIVLFLSTFSNSLKVTLGEQDIDVSVVTHIPLGSNITAQLVSKENLGGNFVLLINDENYLQNMQDAINQKALGALVQSQSPLLDIPTSFIILQTSVDLSQFLNQSIHLENAGEIQADKLAIKYTVKSEIDYDLILNIFQGIYLSGFDNIDFILIPQFSNLSAKQHEQICKLWYLSKHLRNYPSISDTLDSQKLPEVVNDVTSNLNGLQRCIEVSASGYNPDLNNVPILQINNNAFQGNPSAFHIKSEILKFNQIQLENCQPNCTIDLLVNDQCDQNCDSFVCQNDMGQCESRRLQVYLDCDYNDPQCLLDTICDCDGSLGDFRCDLDCNKPECAFDFGDCQIDECFQTCGQYMNDGRCQSECNRDECQLDVNDCRCRFECYYWGADGECDEICNNEQCDYDRGDCDNKNDRKRRKGGDDDDDDVELSGGEIAGIVIGCVAAGAIIMIIIVCICKSRKGNQTQQNQFSPVMPYEQFQPPQKMWDAPVIGQPLPNQYPPNQFYAQYQYPQLPITPGQNN